MKTMMLIGTFLALSSHAFARSYDGCYQLLDTGVMYPAICISGSMEEGIGGANARLAVFSTNTNKLKACLRSTAISITNSKFEFIIDGRKELILSNFSADGKTGNAQLGNTRIKFVRLDERSSRPLTDSAYRGDCL